MWTCENCGCMGIAASLASCPQCRHDRAAPWREALVEVLELKASAQEPSSGTVDVAALAGQVAVDGPAPSGEGAEPQ